jgi:hypothetical protein
MNKCKLCNQADADKKGSHIVPHFLLKRVENIEGETDRDKELGFTLGEFDTKSHFGRAVSPGKLEETYGEVTDELIENNTNSMIVDNFFCSTCEKKFAAIESEYAKTLLKKDSSTYESGVSSSLGLLFWAGVLWRVSINNKSGVKLEEKKEEILRSVIDKYQQIKIEDIDFEALSDDDIAKRLSYKLIRCIEDTSKKSKWLFFHPKFDNPLCILIAEYCIGFSFDEEYQDLEEKNLLEINKTMLNAPVNKAGANELIEPFDIEQFDKTTDAIIETILEVRMASLDEFFNLLIAGFAQYGIRLPETIKQEIFQELISESKELGIRFTIDDIRNSTLKILNKYAP